MLALILLLYFYIENQLQDSQPLLLRLDSSHNRHFRQCSLTCKSLQVSNYIVLILCL